MRNAAARKITDEAEQQQSKLLQALFPHPDDCDRLTVLHIGPALQPTLDFFSNYRCQLHIRDLFTELPLPAPDAEDESPELVLAQAMQIPQDTRFDICLFWDWLNFLDAQALTAFLEQLAPHLHRNTLAHAYAVHNLRSRRAHNVYGVSTSDTIAVKPRSRPVPGYSPHSQRKLKELMFCLDVQRSVLLPDGRLELLLQTKKMRQDA